MLYDLGMLFKHTWQLHLSDSQKQRHTPSNALMDSALSPVDHPRPQQQQSQSIRRDLQWHHDSNKNYTNKTIKPCNNAGSLMADTPPQALRHSQYQQQYRKRNAVGKEMQSEKKCSRKKPIATTHWHYLVLPMQSYSGMSKISRDKMEV